MHIKSLSAEWNSLLKNEFNKTYYNQLVKLVNTAYKTQTIFPPSKLLFNVLQLCSFENIKVVIIGQDPYHNFGQANGLSFSVNDGIKVPPSLQNIFKELKTDLVDFEIPTSGNLESWAKQGVLMLNSVLTVQEGLPGSHKNFGWQQFTDAIIKLVSDEKEKVAFLLWGAFAITKVELIDKNKHLILTAAHPSPLARGAFFGNKHFSKTNNYLNANGITTINWKLI